MANKYPALVFHFRVEWGAANISFSEVSGLVRENQAVEYRWGDSPDYSVIKMPGMVKYNNITMKRGIVTGNNEFYNWLNTIALNQVERRDITISLLNEKHEPIMVWKAHNAFPVKVEGPQMKSSGNEIAIESMEVAHEGLTFETP